MKIDFNSDDNKHVGMEVGNFESMTKMRKKQLPEIQATIQEALKDYDGGSISIIVIKEDENGMPIGHSLLMAGVSRMECQIDMAKSLDMASNSAMEVLLKGADGNIKAMMQIASAMAKHFKSQQEEK